MMKHHYKRTEENKIIAPHPGTRPQGGGGAGRRRQARYICQIGIFPQITSNGVKLFPSPGRSCSPPGWLAAAEWGASAGAPGCSSSSSWSSSAGSRSGGSPLERRRRRRRRTRPSGCPP